MKNSLKVTSNLVSVNWLKANLNSDNLIILDTSIPKVGSVESQTSIKELIPNSLFFDITNAFSNTNVKYPNAFPLEEQFQRNTQLLGVSKDSCVVVYDDKGVYSSARAWLMFKTFGFTNIAVLDGGLPAWKSKGFETVKKYNSVNIKGDFETSFKIENVVDTDFVLGSIHKQICIVDARASERFKGVVEEPRKGVRSGHIPSSKNLPFKKLFNEEGLFKHEDELKLIFKNINFDKYPFIFSCGSGITACVLALGAELAGIKKYAIYDGSWSEWGSRIELPISKY